MEKYAALLLKIPLFHGMSETNMLAIMRCFSVRVKKYAKNEIIYLAGEKIGRVGIILKGKVNIIKEDYEGNRSIIAEFKEGNLFGEAFSFANAENLTVTVLSAAESEILFIDANKIFTICPAACAYHSRLIRNMLEIISAKNILLNEKIDVLSKRTIRNRLLTFLQFQAQKSESNHFSIPFNRQELADYLCVDRSALSSELSKLQVEGLLSFSHNEFTLHRTAEILY